MNASVICNHSPGLYLPREPVKGVTVKNIAAWKCWFLMSYYLWFFSVEHWFKMYSSSALAKIALRYLHKIHASKRYRGLFNYSMAKWHYVPSCTFSRIFQIKCPIIKAWMWIWQWLLQCYYFGCCMYCIAVVKKKCKHEVKMHFLKQPGHFRLLLQVFELFLSHVSYSTQDRLKKSE